MATVIDPPPHVSLKTARAKRRIYLINFGPVVALADFVAILDSIEEFYSRCLGVLYVEELRKHAPALVLTTDAQLLPFPACSIPGLVKSYGAAIRRDGLGINILSAKLNSPGVVTIDGGGEVLKSLIDILHKGKLQKAEMEAVIQRIQAETRFLNAQALEREVTALGTAVQVMKSVGLSDLEIQSRLIQIPGLSDVLSKPIEELQRQKETGNLRGIVEVSE